MQLYVAVLMLLTLGFSFADDTIFIHLDRESPNFNETESPALNVSLVPSTTVPTVGNCIGNELDRKARMFLSECAQLCKQTQGCVGAAYHVDSRRCWLKSSMENCHPVAGSIATLYPNLDCEGDDIEIIRHHDLTACITKCNETWNCSGVQYNSQQNCVLKSGKGDCEETSGGLMVWLKKPAEQQIPLRGYICDGRQIGDANGVDANGCRALCAHTTSCVAFSYNVAKKRCVMRSEMENCTSVQDLTVTIRPNWDCPRNDVATPRVPTLDKCIEKCRKNPNCAGLMYDDRKICNMKRVMIGCERHSSGTSVYVG